MAQAVLAEADRSGVERRRTGRMVAGPDVLHELGLLEVVPLPGTTDDLVRVELPGFGGGEEAVLTGAGEGSRTKPVPISARSPMCRPPAGLAWETEYWRRVPSVVVTRMLHGGALTPV
ncbi:hypothetical protein OHB31_10845 [Streptomyces microflavus]|uniref:hypothetical protein n=1 Tax=Streptomyces TaxID=1883 RepID=UPI0015D4F7EE|nr:MULTISPECIES: hypothetical protein [Streptomyces]MCX4652299.1 hypothetical protein [Streptomyces microflavus]WSA60638.1 hypothetical protein OHB31_10845 [Streptomyces microflavus]